MYVTVHRVRTNPQGGRSVTGFNAFVHLHGAEPVPTVLDPDGVAEASGTLARKSIEIPPGGNFVDSYLDIVAPDDTSAEAMAAVLEEYRNELPRDEREFRGTSSKGAIAIRLVISRRVPASARSEFDRLRKRAVALLDRDEVQSIVIRRLETDDGFHFELVQPTRGGVGVTLSHEVLQAYEQRQGSFFAAVPTLLLTADDLDALPDVEIVDAAGETLWSREARAAGN